MRNASSVQRRFMLGLVVLALLIIAAWSGHSTAVNAQGGTAAATMMATTVSTASASMPATMSATSATTAPSASGTSAATSGGAAVATLSGTAAANTSACDVPAGAAVATASADMASNAAQGDIKVGVAIGISGAAKPYADAQQKGLLLAQSEINKAGGVNGKTIGLVIEDTKSQKDQATVVFQDLINQKVITILGPTLSDEAAAADPIAQTASVPVIGMSNSGNGIVEIGDYIFRDSLGEAAQIPQTVDYLKNQAKIKSVAIVYTQDVKFAADGAGVFKTELDKAGISILDTETVNSTDTDFGPALTKIQGLSSQPDAVVVEALLGPAVAIINKARDLGINQLIVGGNGFNSPLILKLAKGTSDNSVFGGAWSCEAPFPENEAFIKAYIAMWGTAPDQFSAQAYTALYIVADALKRANTTSDTKAMRDALAATKNLATPLGPFSFSDKRDVQTLVYVQMIKGGKFVLVGGSNDVVK